MYDVPRVDTGLESDEEGAASPSRAPVEVSTSLYNPAKYGPNGTLVLAATQALNGTDGPLDLSKLPMSPIVSSMGPQVFSRRPTSPTPKFGHEPRLRAVKPPLCNNLYDITAGDTLTAPRPTTALCSLSGRPAPAAKRFVTTDYDFAVVTNPGEEPPPPPAGGCGWCAEAYCHVWLCHCVLCV